MNAAASELGRALALVMVIEGLLPFVAPSRWRQLLFTIAQIETRNLRLIGLASMLAGVAILQLI